MVNIEKYLSAANTADCFSLLRPFSFLSPFFFFFAFIEWFPIHKRHPVAHASSCCWNRGFYGNRLNRESFGLAKFDECSIEKIIKERKLVGFEIERSEAEKPGGRSKYDKIHRKTDRIANI